jgi:SPP1 gp7 family putative phage head morphogenesis protein
LTQSRIYRIEHQKVLKKQVEAVLEKLHADEYTTIQQFLSDSYTDAFVGTAYDMFGQGVPLILPIDRNAAVKAVTTDSKISEGLYESLGVDTKKLKKSISSEITRGIASGMAHSEIARNLSRYAKVSLGRAKTIVRTESHRIQQASKYDAQNAAKAKGANVVKQWNSTLDGDTRPSHRRLDGQIRELDEPFEMGGKKAMYPGDFGDPAEDCNCRCQILQRARLGLDEDELKTLQERAKFFGLDKSDGLEEFKKKYLKAAENVAVPLEKVGKSDIIDNKKKYAISGQNLSDDLKERSKQVDTILNDFTNKKSKWSGTTQVLVREKMIGVSGRKDWSCDIVLREDAGIKTTIHELLHARSVSYYTPDEYLIWQSVEEGTVELLAQEICKKNGIAYNEAYAPIVKQLRIVNSILEEYESEYDFASALFEVDMPDRYDWLRKKADTIIKKGVLSKKTVTALNTAVDSLNRKV